MHTIHTMLIRMFHLAVWDNAGRQYLPVFDYDGSVMVYARAYEAIKTNTNEWTQEHRS